MDDLRHKARLRIALNCIDLSPFCRASKETNHPPGDPLAAIQRGVEGVKKRLRLNWRLMLL